MKKIYVQLILIILISKFNLAQQLPIDNQYLVNKFSLSPAFSGTNGNTEAFMGYRQNWVGIDGAPLKQMLNINGKIGNNAGLGCYITHENTGNFSHFSGSLSYAYHVELGKEQFLYLGLAAEVYRNQIEGKKVLSNGQDPVLMQNQVLSGTTFNSSFGAVYRNQGFNLGVVLPRILETKIKYGAGSQYTMSREYLIHASVKIDANKKIDIEPIAVLRMTANSGLVYEAAVRVRYQQKIWMGVTYRKDMCIGVHTGLALSQRMVMNYTYEFGTKNILGLSSGSHEFSLGFCISKSKKKNIAPTIFPLDEKEEKAFEVDKQIKALENRVKADSVESNKKIAALEEKIKNLDKKPVEEEQKEKPDESYGKPFILKDIKFGNNSDKLFSSSFPALNKLAAQMMKSPKLTILIVGHTDNNGSSQYNVRLSQKRSEAVKEYLVSKRGISADKIKTEGKGEGEPIDTNDTPEGQAKNRRIEVRFKQSK